MKFAVDAAALNRAVAEPARIAMSAMALTVADGKLTVLADDRTVRLEHRLDVTDDEPGTIYVPPTLFHDLAKTMPPGLVTVSSVGRVVELHGEGDPDEEDDATDHSLWQVAENATDIPAPSADPPIVGDINMRLFDQAMGQVMPAVSTDISRRALTAVQVRSYSGRLSLVATDSYRLHVVRSDMVDAAGWMHKALLPGEAIRLALAVFAPTEEATLHLDRGLMMIRSERTTLTARLVQGEYPPNIRSLIPKRNDTQAHIEVDTERLLEALGRITPVARHKLGLSRVTLSTVPEDGLVIVEAAAVDLGQSSVNVRSHRVDGPGFRFSADIRYLIAALKAANAQRVEIHWTRDQAPILVTRIGDNSKDPAYQAVVMPLHI